MAAGIASSLYPFDIDPDSIDIVVNTRLHFDHCRNNHRFAGRPSYVQPWEPGYRGRAPASPGYSLASRIRPLGRPADRGHRDRSTEQSLESMGPSRRTYAEMGT